MEHHDAAGACAGVASGLWAGGATCGPGAPRLLRGRVGVCRWVGVGGCAAHPCCWRTRVQPWIATTVTPVATEWWLDTLRCFCVPLASIVAMTGMKEQAAKLHAIAPEKIAAGGAYPTAANPPATEPAAVA